MNQPAESDIQPVESNLRQLRVVPARAQGVQHYSRDTQLPSKPHTEIRREGLLQRPNRLDYENDQTLTRVSYIGQQIHYAEKVALAVDLKGVEMGRDTVMRAEALSNATDPDTLAGVWTYDALQQLAVRGQNRHQAYMDGLDSELMNTIFYRSR